MNLEESFREFDLLVGRYPKRVVVSRGVDNGWIQKAEKSLGVAFAPSYRLFLQRYGPTRIGGEELFGLMGVPFSSACGPDVVYQTRQERKDGLSHHLVVLMNNDSEELFVLDTSHKDSDEESPVLRRELGTPEETYAPSFIDYVLKRIRFRSQAW